MTTDDLQMIIYNNRVEITNPNKPLFRGILSLDAFNPYAKNPNIRKFFSEFNWTDEIGSGVRNVHKYLNEYVPGAKPLFIEDDRFKTIIPLISSVLGKEKAAIFMELVGLDKSKLNTETIEAIEALALAPEYSEIENPDELFFKKGASWGEKGGKLFDKRTTVLFKILLLCIASQHRDYILSILEFNSRDRFRELYLQPLRQEGLLEYTIKNKPNSPDQRYVTSEKGRRFLGGFDI